MYITDIAWLSYFKTWLEHKKSLKIKDKICKYFKHVFFFNTVKSKC